MTIKLWRITCQSVCDTLFSRHLGDSRQAARHVSLSSGPDGSERLFGVRRYLFFIDGMKNPSHETSHRVTVLSFADNASLHY